MTSNGKAASWKSEIIINDQENDTISSGGLWRNESWHEHDTQPEANGFRKSLTSWSSLPTVHATRWCQGWSTLRAKSSAWISWSGWTPVTCTATTSTNLNIDNSLATPRCRRSRGRWSRRRARSAAALRPGGLSAEFWWSSPSCWRTTSETCRHRKTCRPSQPGSHRRCSGWPSSPGALVRWNLEIYAPLCCFVSWSWKNLEPGRKLPSS